MSMAMSVFSNKIITEKGLGSVLRHLDAGHGGDGAWLLERNGRNVAIRLASRDIEDLHVDFLVPVGRLLGDMPKSRVALTFNASNPDQFELRMARAVAVAMAEVWPVVLDDHAGVVEMVHPPGADPSQN